MALYRGKLLALPIPNVDDLRLGQWSTEREAVTFSKMVAEIPEYSHFLEGVEEEIGHDATASCLALLSLINETCLRQNR